MITQEAEKAQAEYLARKKARRADKNFHRRRSKDKVLVWRDEKNKH